MRRRFLASCYGCRALSGEENGKPETGNRKLKWATHDQSLFSRFPSPVSGFLFFILLTAGRTWKCAATQRGAAHRKDAGRRPVDRAAPSGYGAQPMVRGRHSCALVLVLIFLVGTALSGAPLSGGASGCRQCRPGCPMHAGHLGCHHASDAGCHHSREPGLRCACGSHSETSTTPLPVFRAVLVLRSESLPIVTQSPLTSSPRVLATQFVLEPPTNPPRTSAV